MEKLKRGDSLSDKAYDYLLSMIRDMSPGANKLPSEDELSEMMGVSRATVREALKRLLSNGYITPVQGKGNYAHPSAIKVKNRIDLYTDFLALLGRQYADVSVRVEHLGQVAPSEVFRREFPDSAEAYAMIWQYAAQDRIMLYGCYEFPMRVFRQPPDRDADIRDLVTFSRKFLTTRIAYCSMRLRCGTNEKAARQFGVAPDAPLLSWEELIRDIGDFPVGRATFYVHPDNLEMSVVTHFGS